MRRGVRADRKAFVRQLTHLRFGHRRKMRRGGGRRVVRRGHLAPTLVRQGAKPGDGIGTERAHHRIEPEQPLTADRFGADEHCRGNPVAPQDRPRDLEDAAIAIVEGDQHGTIGQRPHAAAGLGEHREIDRMTGLGDHAAMSVEGVGIDVQVGVRRVAIVDG